MRIDISVFTLALTTSIISMWDDELDLYNLLMHGSATIGIIITLWSLMGIVMNFTSLFKDVMFVNVFTFIWIPISFVVGFTVFNIYYNFTWQTITLNIAWGLYFVTYLTHCLTHEP